MHFSMQQEGMSLVPVNPRQGKVAKAIKAVPRALWRAVGFGLGAIGLAGLPDDLLTWSGWIETAMKDERVLLLANKAVEIAQFANQWWVRGLFIAAGLSILFWAWKPFWSLRHRINFSWRKLVSAQVWISKDVAIDVIKGSEWGQIKAPTVTRNVKRPSPWNNIFGQEETEIHVSGLRESDKADIKFNAWVSIILEKFIEMNPSSSKKEEDGNILIDEILLKKYLLKAIESEVFREFGEPPVIKF